MIFLFLSQCYCNWLPVSLGSMSLAKSSAWRLVNSYCNIYNVCLYTKMLLVLSFVPLEDVAECFNMLNESRPHKLVALYDCWKDNYIGRMRRNRRAHPLFDIVLCNMHWCVAGGLSKTNNSLESWHYAFQATVDCHHPNICMPTEHFCLE